VWLPRARDGHDGHVMSGSTLPGGLKVLGSIQEPHKTRQHMVTYRGGVGTAILGRQMKLG
jgi:hypothetical protein